MDHGRKANDAQINADVTNANHRDDQGVVVLSYERLAVNDTGDVIRAVDSQHDSPKPQCRRCDNASSEVFSTSCNSVERYETAGGPTACNLTGGQVMEVSTPLQF